jgi:hypothetical protein
MTIPNDIFIKDLIIWHLGETRVKMRASAVKYQNPISTYAKKQEVNKLQIWTYGLINVTHTFSSG